MDKFAAKLSYNSLVDIMPRASHLQGQASANDSDDTPHPVFVHRKSNEAVFDYNVSAMRRSVYAPESRSQRHVGTHIHTSGSATAVR